MLGFLGKLIIKPENIVALVKKILGEVDDLRLDRSARIGAALALGRMIEALCGEKVVDEALVKEVKALLDKWTKA